MKRKLVSLSLIAVIVPISLMVSLKLAGVIREPVNPIVTYAEPVYLRVERPVDMFDKSFYGKCENVYTTEEQTINISVNFYRYEYEAEWAPYHYRSGMDFGVFLSGNIKQGFGVSTVIKYCRANDETRIAVISPGKGRDWDKIDGGFTNATLVKWLNDGVDTYEEVIVARPTEQSYSIFMEAYWIFTNLKQLAPYSLELTVENTYFNGTTYRKVIVPVVLEAWPDTQNYENSLEMGFPNIIGALNGASNRDIADFYKVNVEVGQPINITMSSIRSEKNPALYVSADLYLYDPNGELKASSCLNSTVSLSDHIEFTADSSGEWYIKVQYVKEEESYFLGQYLLESHSP
ncbi:MAG: PPC domain-containing protein [Candidatus Bathyarchaeia archaeon]